MRHSRSPEIITPILNVEEEEGKASEKDATPSGKVLVKSFGCQMNVYDATRISDLLAAEGYDSTDNEQDADLVILNTCHIREKAAEKIYSELGKLAIAKRDRAQEGRELKIIVAGCVAQAEGEEVLRRQSAVDLVVGPQSYHRLPALIQKAKLGLRATDTEFSVEEKFNTLPQPTLKQINQRGIAAFVTVQEGCDKFCSFCVVPYTRGAEVSRNVNDIIAEIRRLIDAGVREITLIGQNVNAFRGEAANGQIWSLADLIGRCAEITGLERLRYTTSHPVDMSDDLISAHGSISKLMPYVHLPVQSGSDRVLKAMNRKHTTEDYLHIISRLRAARQDLAVSSDFIVGFPGETEKDFQETLDLIKSVNYASSFSFKYSPRPGTPGAQRSDQITEEIKRQRLAELQALLEQQRQSFNRAMVNKEIDVLFEKPGRHEGQIGGKSPYLQAVHVDGPISLIGKIARVAISATGPNSLTGNLIHMHQQAVI